MSLGRCGTCAREWNGTRECHCATCHLQFGSVSAFDRHRVAFACLPVADFAKPTKSGLPRLVPIERPVGLLWVEKRDLGALSPRRTPSVSAA